MLFESLKKYLRKVWNGIDTPCYGKFLIFYETFPKFYTVTKFHFILFYYTHYYNILFYDTHLLCLITWPTLCWTWGGLTSLGSGLWPKNPSLSRCLNTCKKAVNTHKNR